jgi:amino acid adenylation domain-containing protein/non-ribosomal peptide synthase protein (TIGR01720 family)
MNSSIENIINKARESGIQLLVENDKLKLRKAKDRDVAPELLKMLNDHKEAIKQLLLVDKEHLHNDGPDNRRITRENGGRPEQIALSFSQERIWAIDQLQGSTQYHMPWVARLKGDIDRTMLEASFRDLILRHEILRTVVRQENGIGYQHIMPAGDWCMDYIHRKEVTDGNLTLLIESIIERPFDLSCDPVLRVALIQLSLKEYMLVVVTHHIASDGWSIPIIARELTELYNSRKEGREPVLKPMQVQYADYALWQRRYLSGEHLLRKLIYWKQQLYGVAPLVLPTDYSRSENIDTRGGIVSKALNSNLHDQLLAMSRDHGVTLFITMLSVFKVLLYRYAGQEDICVGIPVAGRDMEEIEGLVGPFVNSLALRSAIRSDMTFKELLQQVRKTSLDAFAHQNTPFEKVVEVLELERSLSRNPVFQVMFSLEYSAEDIPGKIGDAYLTKLPVGRVTSKFDISLNVYKSEQQFRFSITYRQGLFRKENIVRMCGHYERLLKEVLKDAELTVSGLPMLSKKEETLILSGPNASSVIYPFTRTIINLFEEQALKSGPQNALAFEGETLTFAALNEAANRLAHYLYNKGVRKGDKVLLSLDRSLHMITGLLGILKAGAAYVPAEPGYPVSRLEYIIKTTKVKAIIGHSSHREVLDNFREASTLIEIDKEADLIAACSGDNLDKVVYDPNDLAYVIFTSGSTGAPKGVMITHHNLLDYIYGLKDKLKIDQYRSFALVSTIAADLGNTMLYSALCFGGTLHLFSESVVNDAHALHDYFSRQFIDCVKIVPSHWKALMLNGNLLLPRGVLIFGGEALSPDIITKIKASGAFCKIVNHYGPTETTIGKLLHIVDKEFSYEGHVPIGQPFSNTRVYVLSKGLSLSPIGVPGELYIEGNGVSPGYINNPTLTEERFIPNPFNRKSGSLMYRTGDLVKYDEEGNITYLGRVDEQVKIRGFRIEPGEVESVLQACVQVKQCAVLAKEDEQGTKHLVAYVMPEKSFDKAQIKQYLRSRLPEYMIPAFFIEVDNIPLTPNGKVNRKELQKHELLIETGSYVAPRNAIEEQLAEVWKDMFGKEQIGIHANFFELGGDSIITIQLVSRVKQLGLEVSARDIFQHQSIAELSSVIATRKTMVSSAERGALDGRCGLLPIQQWYFDRNPLQVSHYNQHIMLLIDKAVTPGVLKTVRFALVSHHDALRFRFEKKQGWEQFYGNSGGTLEVIDLSGVDAGRLTAEIRLQSDYYQRTLDIEQGVLSRFVLMQTPADEQYNRLLITVHHLAMDGISWRILLDDLDLLLISMMENRKTALPAKSHSYRQWHKALTAYGNSAGLLNQAAYWKHVVQSYRPLPVDKGEGEVCRIADMKEHTIKLDRRLTCSLLQEVAVVYHTEINDLLLSALAKALVAWSRFDSIVIGMEGHGREFIAEGVDVSRTIGWFTSLYPVLLNVDPDLETDSLVKSVKEQLRKVPDKGIGYGVLKYMVGESSLQEGGKWDIVFNYLGQADNVATGSRWISMGGEPSGEALSGEIVRYNKLEVNSVVLQGEMIIKWSYSSRHYETATIELLAEKYIEHLEDIISHCLARKEAGPAYTPADFGLGKEISYQELDRFLATTRYERPVKDQIEGLHKLSGLQEGILFHDLYDDDSHGSYVQQMKCTLEGLQEEVFSLSWQYLMKRHSILRTGFYYDEFNIPVQCVYHDVALPLFILDHRHLSPEEQAQEEAKYEKADRLNGFDLKAAPLMRINLLRIRNNRYKMIWTSHHLISDGWSRFILIEEFLRIYDALILKGETPLIAEDRYADFIHYLEGQDKERQLLYWRDYMKGLEQATLLPFAANIPERNRSAGLHAHVSLQLDAEISDRVFDYALQQHLTVNTLFQGVWAYLLHRYTGNAHISFGVTLAGRPESLLAMEQRVGLYINTLPLHAALKEEQTGAAWLESIQYDQLQSRQYQYVSLTEVQRLTGIQENLFDTIMVFENYPVSETLLSDKWQLKASEVEVAEQTNYPLSIRISAGEKIDIQFSYNGNILTYADVERISGHFEQVLRQFIANDGRELAAISLLTTTEEEVMLNWMKGKGDKKDRTFSLVGKLLEQLRTGTNNIAVSYKDTRMTYAEADDLVLRMGAYLKQRGLRKGDRVVVLLNRSPWIPVTLLTLLQNGWVYVPVDAANPWERIRFIVEDVEPALIITDVPLDNMPENDFRWLTIEALVAGMEDQGTVAASGGPVLGQRDEAYIIYTSGSTGTPKGVIVTYRNIDHFFGHVHAAYACDDRTVMPFMASHAFDISLFQLLNPLLQGGTCIIMDREQLQDMEQLFDMLSEITVLDTVPGMYRLIVNHIDEYHPGADLGRIRQVFIGGDHIPDDLLEKLRRLFVSATIIVTYGPTEGTIFCTHLVYEPGDSVEVFKGALIGQPVEEAAVYVMENGLIMPAGVEGEICIGGLGVSDGYLNNAALTAGKFIRDHYYPDQLIYRTGDRARWTTNGILEFRGRKDDQVKIRGFRIEPGEIEARIKEHAAIADVVVVAAEQPGLEKCLAAYYIRSRDVEAGGDAELSSLLRDYLGAQLPWYMVPAYFTELDSFPLTSNGKLNKRALTLPSAGVPLRSYSAPRTALEAQLCEVWAEVLGRERVGIYDNFFELGGDSIITIQVVSRVRRQGYTIVPRDIFTYQTIALLSASLSLRAGWESGGEQGLLEGNSGLLPVQQQFLQGGGPGLSHFNQSLLVAIPKDRSAVQISASLRLLAAHHDSLRFRYRYEESTGWQQYYSNQEPGEEEVPEVADLREVAAADLAGAMSSLADTAHESLDITGGPVLRAVLLLLPESEPNNRLLLVVHHLVVDGVSWRILLEDLQNLLSTSQAASLGTKSSSYRQWYQGLEAYSRSQRLLSQLGYWQARTTAYQSTSIGPVATCALKDTATVSVRLPAMATRQLLEVAPGAYHTAINDLLLCALGQALSHWQESDQVLIGLEGHGREESLVGGGELDLSRTVGWFTSFYPLLLELEAGEDPGNQLRSVKEQLRRVPDKGIGYGVLKYLCGASSLEGPCWDIVFNYLGQTDQMGEVSADGGVPVSPSHLFPYRLEINSMVHAGELLVNWRYNGQQYEASAMESLAASYITRLSQLVSHCAGEVLAGRSHVSPSDYGLGAEVSYGELDSFLQAVRGGVPLKEQLSGLYRLSPLQEGLLFHSVYESGSRAYIHQLRCRISGLDAEALLSGWQQLLSRHSILRSGFYYDSFRIPVQVVYTSATLPVKMIDCRGANEAQQQEEMAAHASADFAAGFDLREAPLMRLSLVQVESGSYHLILTSHHLILDGWSLPLLMKELLNNYDLLVRGEQVPVGAEDRYEDYIRYLEDRDKEEEESYWRGYLTGLSGGTLLPFVTTRTTRNKAVVSFKIDLLQLDEDFSSQINAFAQQHHLTVNTLMQGVWAYLLGRYTGNKDVVFGVTVSGRPEELPGIEERIGMYINTLPLRTTIDSSGEVVKWLQAMQREQLASRQYQYVSLNEMQRWTDVKGELFDSLLTFQNFPANEITQSANWQLEIEDLQVQEQSANYTLGLRIHSSSEIVVQFLYKEELLNQSCVLMIKDHFRQVLLDIITKDNIRIADIRLLTPGEEQQLLGNFRGFLKAYSGHSTITAMFAEQAVRTPDAVALVFEGEELSYRALDERANQLACFLIRKGVQKENLVAVCLNRSLEMIISILAILKAGGAYVPIDPESPQDRINYMLKDSNCAVVITTDFLKETIVFPEVMIICIDTMQSLLTLLPADNVQQAVHPGDLAYVIYTSGSTGTPKGVMIEHGSVVNMVHGKAPALGLREGIHVFQFSSLSFDASCYEIFGTLLYGGKLILASKSIILSPPAFASFLQEQQIELITLPPSYQNVLQEETISVKTIVSGGEALSPTQARILQMKGIKVVNCYGPTENTVCSAWSENPLHNSGVVTIGAPVGNVEAYILDEALRPVPVGVTGELYLGGPQLARGYLNNQALTDEKFVHHPFAVSEGSRLYRTGDLVYWLPDGNIVYAGRTDDQVKIRGYRIELGEIEAVLKQGPGIVNAAVIVSEGPQDNKQLLAYVVTSDDFDRSRLQAYLQSRLPDYMIPASLIKQDMLPLSMSDKVDRKRLLENADIPLPSDNYVEPRNDLEHVLAGIWKEILGTGRIGVYDDFFQAGGNSLLAIRLISHIKKELSIEVPIHAIFQFSCINDLCKYIEFESGIGKDEITDAFQTIDIQ